MYLNNFRKYLLLVTIMIMLLPVLAFTGGTPEEADVKIEADGLIVCPEPRPQICTMDYVPVCAQLQDGRFKVYSNGCSSCSDPEVVGYREGECTEEK